MAALRLLSMYPYSLEIENEVDLFHLSDGRYQLIKSGKISPIMSGFKYLLVEDEIASYLQSLEIERVTYSPAIIWDRKNDIEHKNYQSMNINHHFESGEISDIDLTGKQFLLMGNRYPFVTPELKSTLENSPYNFKFSHGLSNFG